MKRTCTNCTKSFTAPDKKGRPPSFCSEECRKLARQSRTRVCVTCEAKFSRDDSPWPNHCSEACHTPTMKCLGCDKPLGPEGIGYCSAFCLEISTEPTFCRTCNGPVPLPSDPPFNKRPKFCSAQCRQDKYEQHSTAVPTSDDVAFRKALSGLPTPYQTLPAKAGGYLPYRRLTMATIPDIKQCSPKLRNSIAYWNAILPQHLLAEDQARDFFIAWIGSIGMGGPDTPTGCLPLINCYPMLNPITRSRIKPEVFNWWVYRRAARTHNMPSELFVLRCIDLMTAFANGLPRDDKRFKEYFTPDQSGKPRIYYMVQNIINARMPPPLSSWAGPYLESATNGPLQDLFQKLNKMYLKEAKPGTTPPWKGAVKYPVAKPDQPTRWETLSQMILTRRWI